MNNTEICPECGKEVPPWPEDHTNRDFILATLGGIFVAGGFFMALYLGGKLL